MQLDDAVVRAAQRGDHDAFRVLYSDLSPKVFGYLRARGVEEPEELANEVFLAVYRRLGELRGGVSGLRTLVFSIAHARSVDDVRRRARRPQAVPYEPHDDERSTPSAESHVVHALEVQRALDHLEGLNEDQRTVIMLRIIGDLSLQETAAAIGRSVASVKQLQRRGLVALRARMHQEEGVL